jgi:hypothetical protein
VLFETLPVLRGGVGNVVYFFLWTAAIALSVTGFDDPAGLQLLTAAHEAPCMRSIPAVLRISISA